MPKLIAVYILGFDIMSYMGLKIFVLCPFVLNIIYVHIILLPYISNNCGPFRVILFLIRCAQEQRDINLIHMKFQSRYQTIHDDVIKWTPFPRCWAFVRGILESPVDSPHKGHWSTSLMFSYICAWKTGVQKIETLVISDIIALIMKSL